MSTVKTKRMTVRCPKCGERFEVEVPLVEMIEQMPSVQILLHEVQCIQTSREAAKIWREEGIKVLDFVIQYSAVIRYGGLRLD